MKVESIKMSKPYDTKDGKKGYNWIIVLGWENGSKVFQLSDYAMKEAAEKYKLKSPNELIGKDVTIGITLPLRKFQLESIQKRYDLQANFIVID